MSTSSEAETRPVGAELSPDEVGRDGARIVVVVLGALALVGLHCFDRRASEAACEDLARRYEDLALAAKRPSGGAHRLHVDGCLASVSRRQASCAAEAADLDRFEECFF